jgi:hypothetical protein
LKKVKVEKALGMTLAHDITEILPGKRKDVAFERGRIIQESDIGRLLDLGKGHLYVFDGPARGVHEDDAGMRIAQSIIDVNMECLPPKEGKVSIASKIDGLFYVNERYLYEMNRIRDVLLSTVPNRYPVKPGQVVAATRIIPLYIQERALKRAERIGEKRVIRISPFKSLKAGLVITGTEIYSGRIQDGSYVVEDKLRNYGITITGKQLAPDNPAAIGQAILDLFAQGTDIVITTAGLSVDPDDVTKEGIEATGAKVLFYGTPVFPGAMFLVAHLNGRYILGAPACVYYNRFTVLDMILTRIMAGEEVRKSDVVKLSYGGLCLHCEPCHYPVCSFGKAP